MLVPYPALTALPIVTPLPAFDGATIYPLADDLYIRIGDADGFRSGHAVTQGCALQPLCPQPTERQPDYLVARCCSEDR
jgi:hypothetical protein